MQDATRLVAGIGISSLATLEELEQLVADALAETAHPWEELKVIATLDMRCTHPALLALVARHGMTLCGLTAPALAEVRVTTPSAAVAAHVGTESVAEAAALLASRASELLLPKRASAHATVALAIIYEGVP